MSQKAQRVAVFGGAFDPFHFGHVAAIRLLLSLPDIARVIVVPSGDRPDKQHVSCAADRFEMTRAGVKEIFADEPRVVVSDVQSSGKVGFSTFDLVSHLRSDYGEGISVVIGQELLKDLSSWHRAEELSQLAQFLVLARPETSSSHAQLGGWRLEVLPGFGQAGVKVSSTELRERLAKGERCQGLLPDIVRDYCVTKGLYVPGKERQEG